MHKVKNMLKFLLKIAKFKILYSLLANINNFNFTHSTL